ncbi:RNA-binding S4 domain-containing protein [Ferrovibrio sp.]|uniref:RNA-binding S4 domain-containing protein n=1 Tax=Ferrovibrio sp. TaxID=1917215 RepID=UPI00260735E6|nr:RNA-binding S4 domain-containing protein [Ferrovibrio sp.]
MTEDENEAAALRLDKWLWLARFCKTRAIGQKMAGKGRIRINGRVVDKPHALVRVGDVLTLPLPAGVKVIRILSLPSRRGPAPEAQATYETMP